VAEKDRELPDLVCGDVFGLNTFMTRAASLVSGISSFGPGYLNIYERYIH
jgi:hypothetical protein